VLRSLDVSSTNLLEDASLQPFSKTPLQGAARDGNSSQNIIYVECSMRLLRNEADGRGNMRIGNGLQI
jgi:hypothetical protein